MHRDRPQPPQPRTIDLTEGAHGVFQDLRPRYRPALTKAIVGLLIGVFLLQLLSSPAASQALYAHFAVDAEAIREGAWWRIFTGALLHGGALHLAVNAYSAWIVGRRLEAYIGPWQLGLITLAATVGAGLAVVWGNQNAVGFSGALYGWLASWLAFHLTPRYPGLRLSGPELRSFLTILLVNGLISLSPGISARAHVGGFVAGFLAAGLLGVLPRTWRG